MPTSPRAITSPTDEVRTRLESERESQRALAQSLNAELDAIHTGADTVEASGDDEFGEGAATPVDRDRLRALVAAAHHHLDEIDRALRRLDAGTYGTCEVCGQSIDPARLDALPAATLCVGCKAGGLSTRRPGPGRTRAA